MSIWGGRRFSTLRKRLSMTGSGKDDLNAEKAKLKQRLQQERKSMATGSTDSGSLSRLGGGGKHLSIKSVTTLGASGPQTLELDPMPPEDEVNEMLELTLDEMAVPDGNKDKFRSQPVEKRWEVVQMHNKFNPAKRIHAKEDQMSPGFWIRKLKERDSKGRPRLNAKDALKMESVFRTSHRDFLSKFLESFGVMEMNKTMDLLTGRKPGKDAAVVASLIESYRHVMNTELGMRGVLLVPGSVNSIAMAMDFTGENHAITEKVLLLLSVACWFSEDGRRKVMESIRYLKARYKEMSCFLTLVYLFEHTNEASFKASLARFFVMVCNAPQTVEKRIAVRSYFLRLDIINVFEKILAKVHEQELAMDEESPWQAIQTQYQVFVAMMREDQKEIVGKMVVAAEKDASHFDLSNLQEAWKVLQKNALKSDTQEELLNVIHALFLVPTVNEIAVPIFESIARFIFEAASVDRLLMAAGEKVSMTVPPPLNFEELGKCLQKKAEYNAKVEAFEGNHGLTVRLRKLVGILQKRLTDVSSGKIPLTAAMDLQEELVKNHLLKPGNRSGVAAPQVAGGSAVAIDSAAAALGMITGINNDVAFLTGIGMVDSGGEIEIMKEREEKLKQEIDQLRRQVEILSKGGKVDPNLLKPPGPEAVKPEDEFKGKLDSTGLAPAGIAPGKEMKPPPPVPKPGMPGSLENAPIQVGAEEADNKEANPEGAVAALFAGKGKPKPNKPKSNKAKHKEALEKLGLPEKAPIQPGVKMQQVFWKVIAPDALEGTLWPELSDQNVKYDVAELEELFGKIETEKKDAKGKAEKPDNENVKLIDSQRRQNLGIALRRVNLPSAEIKAAIIAADTIILSKDRIQVFIDTIPTVDELTLLNKYFKDGGKEKDLESEELYLHEVSQVPALEARLRCIKTAHTFKGDAKRIFSVIQRMKAALKEINNSVQLRQILEIVLAIGNHLNGGTARGAAWGFKVDILANLSNVKDANNNGTLMHYLFALFERNYPELCEFSLPASAQVVDINFKETVREMNNLAQQVSLLKVEVKKKPFSKADKFRKTFSGFEVKATKDCENLQNQLEKVRSDFHSLALRFAESGAEVEPISFFPKFVTFEQDLKRAGAQMKEMKENEERRIAMEAKKQERNALRKLKLLVEKTKDADGNLNMGLIEAYKQSQQGKANEVVDRFLSRYKNTEKKEKRKKKDRDE